MLFQASLERMSVRWLKKVAHRGVVCSFILPLLVQVVVLWWSASQYLHLSEALLVPRFRIAHGCEGRVCPQTSPPAAGRVVSPQPCLRPYTAAMGFQAVCHVLSILEASASWFREHACRPDSLLRILQRSHSHELDSSLPVGG